MHQVLRGLLAVMLVAGIVGVAIGSDLGAQESRVRAVDVSAGPAGLVVKPLVAHDSLHLRVAAPDGRMFDRESTGGVTVVFNPFGVEGYQPPDGIYVWEARLSRLALLAPQLRALAAAARQTGDPEIETAFRVAEQRATLVESGAFQVREGAVVPSDRVEPQATPGGRRTQRLAAPITWNLDDVPPFNPVDFVIADDLIVQGSACVGLDCVNNENFGFDTIRLKENNTRIQFDDTSTSAGFPTNNWQIRANSSASGGASFLGFVDQGAGGNSETGTLVLSVGAGAPANSLFVDSTGRVGFRTATPVLDLHVATSNTPATRLEQNSSGGFTAQTWDIAGNEANFFVRDVTGGSRLPFRIRPGAPTSSLDINAAGRVGIGTASPESNLHVFGQPTADTFIGIGPNPDGSVATESALNIGHAADSVGRAAGFFNVRPDSNAVAPNPSLRFFTGNTHRLIIDNEGFVGLGGQAFNPAHPIHHAATNARLDAAGIWQNGSSRDLKTDIQALGAEEARATLDALSPVKYAAKVDPTVRHVGFIAEDVPDLVATKDRKTLSPMDIVAVLTRIVQEQQKTIAELTEKVKALEGAGAR